MKKLLCCMLFSFISILFFTKNSEHCSATDNTLYVKVKYITASEAAALNNDGTSGQNGNVVIAAGDYAVSLYITNNTGFTAIGFRIYCDTDLVAPLTYGNNEIPAHRYGSAGDDVSATVFYNSENGILGIATTSPDGEYDDGMIVTYFVRPLQGFNINVDETNIIIDYDIERWLDEQVINIIPDTNNQVTYHHYVETYSCIYGDLNNDGDVASDDAQLLLNIYNANGELDLDTMVYDTTYTAPGVSIYGSHLAAVSDINQDGVINSDDVDLISEYYVNYVVIGLSGYNGIIGTTAYYYIEYTVPLPSNNS